jgi:hypothetical protein
LNDSISIENVAITNICQKCSLLTDSQFQKIQWVLNNQESNLVEISHFIHSSSITVENDESILIELFCQKNI